MNERLQLTTRDTITFKRIDTKACIGYEIYARRREGDEVLEFLLDTISNPITPTPFKKTRDLNYNQRKVWEIGEKILAKTSSDVAVFVNQIRLNPGQYTFSSALGLLNIHVNINKKDLIKIEYNVDRIKYIHNTTRKHEYRIVPLYKSDYRLGEHSLLNY
ncbi:MAG: hypothetical protein RR744_09400 [Cellulosilyticaceae bacterium]